MDGWASILRQVELERVKTRLPGACWGSRFNGSLSCSRQLQGKASAPMGVAFALLAPADPGATAALDHWNASGRPAFWSTPCSNPAEDSYKSGRSGRHDLKNRTENSRNRHVGMKCRVIRPCRGVGFGVSDRSHEPRRHLLVQGAPQRVIAERLAVRTNTKLLQMTLTSAASPPEGTPFKLPNGWRAARSPQHPFLGAG